MAITFTSSPNPTIPFLGYGENKIKYNFTSNTATIVSCIVEVLVTGVRVAAVSVQPNKGTTDEFTLAVNDILQTQLDFKLYTTALSTYDIDADGAKVFTIKIYEVTESGGVLTTAYNPDDANNSSYDAYISNASTVINWTLDTVGHSTLTITDYQLTANTKKFLNDTPTAKNIELSQSEYLGALYYNGTASQAFKIEYLTYDASDALLNTDYINITDWDGAASSNVPNPYLTIPVGTSNLIAAGISLTNVAYYTVRIINSTGDVSELKRYNIVDSCTHDVRIHWQNKYGKRDSYTFKGNKQESLDHEASTFMKAKGLTYSSDARGISVMQNTLNSTFTAYSKSIGRDEYHWLSDMLINKRAWVEIDGSYLPIIIEDGTFFKTDERDMPIQFVLNYSFANPTKGLRG
tara:strand:+ start:16504 stop:17721 length:1218 start_codon:yes stop_codon:yes gene_type:complete